MNKEQIARDYIELLEKTLSKRSLYDKDEIIKHVSNIKQLLEPELSSPIELEEDEKLNEFLDDIDREFSGAKG